MDRSEGEGRSAPRHPPARCENRPVARTGPPRRSLYSKPKTAALYGFAEVNRKKRRTFCLVSIFHEQS